jgi:hypothetical protein
MGVLMKQGEASLCPVLHHRLYYIILILLLLGPVLSVADDSPGRISNVIVSAGTDESPQQCMMAGRAAEMDESCPSGSYSWRGILIGGDHGPEMIHHDNAYAQIDGGPILYQGTIPARKASNVLPDAGLLWHLYTRNNRNYTIYAASSYEDGLSSVLSAPLTLSSCFPANGCSEQTVPVAVAGSDQIVAAGLEVVLDAGASYDPYGPDNNTLIYRWQCYSAPETVTLSDGGATSIARFTPTTHGRYYFRLTVRDSLDGGITSFNRSDPVYLRVAVVSNPDDPTFVEANAGGVSNVQIGAQAILDGSRSIAPTGASYQWTQLNPVGNSELNAMAAVLGTEGCLTACYEANFDGDSDTDGVDLALLANNWGPTLISSAPVAAFTPHLPRPYIFRLTVTSGSQSSSETAIVGAYHPKATELMTQPPVDAACL